MFDRGNSAPGGAARPPAVRMADPSAEAPGGQSVTVPLTTPIETHSGRQSVLVLRTPTFGEWIDIGPIESLVHRGGGDVSEREMEGRLDRDVLLKWMVLLSGHDRVVLAKLAPIDAYRVSQAVCLLVGVFTMGNSATASTSSSSSAA